MFIIMRQRKSEHGHKRWMEVRDEGFSGEERALLDAKAWTETQNSPLFEFAVFEQLVSPAPEAP